MAGAGWRQFTVGQLLTSAQVQTFLQDQAVQVFASAAARTSALGTAVSEGMVSYRTDGKALELYANSAWTPVMQGRNAIINGGFDIWQRGASISNFGFFQLYTADRWNFNSSNSGRTISRQVTGDTTNLPDVQFCARVQRDSGNTDGTLMAISQSVETSNSIPLAGKTVAFSFYARRGANYSATSNVLEAAVFSGTGTDQSITGGFTGQVTLLNSNITLTTTWQRFTFTVTVPATSRQLAVRFIGTPTGTAGAADFYEITGVDLEAGSVATPFARAAPTLQGELAACQRYYYRSSGPSFAVHGSGQAYSTTQVLVFVQPPVSMRTTAAAIDHNFMQLLIPGFASYAISTLVLSGAESTTQSAAMVASVASGLTQHRQYYLSNANNAAGYIGISAEL